MTAMTSHATAGRFLGWKSDMALALLADAGWRWRVNAAAGFRKLANAGGDNDSLLRLVEVRDLIAGQGWFDLHQYRMGPEGGFVMHWSRLVDAPIAAIILAASALTGSMAMAEAIAQVLWPALLFCLARVFHRSARRAASPATAPCCRRSSSARAALHFIGIFSPGALDHHNVQLMLTLASLSLLLEAPTRRWAALISGLCAALTLAVGMETAPYVAAIGACVALLFLVDRRRRTADRQGFRPRLCRRLGARLRHHRPAIGLGPGAMRCLLGRAVRGRGDRRRRALPPSRRSRSPTARPAARLISLGLLALVLGAVVVALFPQCLAAPYANLDPRLQGIVARPHRRGAVAVQSCRQRSGLGWRRAMPRRWWRSSLMALRLPRTAWRRQDSLVGALLVVRLHRQRLAGPRLDLLDRLCRHPAVGLDRKLARAGRGPARRAASSLQHGGSLAGLGECRLGRRCRRDVERVRGRQGLRRGKGRRQRSAPARARPPSRRWPGCRTPRCLPSPISARRSWPIPGTASSPAPIIATSPATCLRSTPSSDRRTQARTIAADHHVGLVALCRGNAESRARRQGAGRLPGRADARQRAGLAGAGGRKRAETRSNSTASGRG